MKWFLIASLGIVLSGCGPKRSTDPDELALQIIKASGAEAQMSAMLDTMTAQAPPENAAAIKGLFNVSELSGRMVPIYKKHFTVDEMQQMLDFHESELGKKMKGLNPTLVKEGAEIGQKYVQEKIAAIQQTATP